MIVDRQTHRHTQIERHTDTLITILRSSIGGGVKKEEHEEKCRRVFVEPLSLGGAAENKTTATVTIFGSQNAGLTHVHMQTHKRNTYKHIKHCKYHYIIDN